MRNELAERILKSNQTLLDAYENLDPNDPNYFDHLKVLTGMHQQCVEDYKTEVFQDVEMEKVQTEKTRNWTGFVTGILTALAAFFAALVGFFGIKYSEEHIDRRFNVANKFEDSDAYLKMSSKSAVNDGLRSRRR